MTQYVLPKLVDDGDKRVALAYSRIYGNILEQIESDTNHDLYIEVKRATRSLKQNAYLWSVVYPTISRFMSENHNKDYSDEAIHEACKEQFLLARVEQFATREVRVYKSTKELTKQEFSDYVEELFRWAGGFGCSIPEPDWAWKMKREQAA